MQKSQFISEMIKGIRGHFKMIIIVIIIIALVSIGLAYISLRNLEKMKEIDAAKKELNKGKIIFHSDSSASSESSDTKSSV